MNIKISDRDQTITEITLRDLFALAVTMGSDIQPLAAYDYADKMIQARREY